MSRDNDIIIEDGKLQELMSDPLVSNNIKIDPSSLINNSLMGMNFNLTFEPLKQVLMSICENNKLTKIKINDLVQENSSLKSRLSDLENKYEERFMIIQAKIGDIHPESAAKFDSIDRAFDDINDEAKHLHESIAKTMENENNPEKIQVSLFCF